MIKKLNDNGIETDGGEFGILKQQRKQIEKDFDKFLSDVQYKASTRKFSAKENFPDDMHELYDLLGTEDGQDVYAVFREVTHVVNLRMAKKYKYNYERLPNE
jgi:hypothetical protein